MKTNFLYFREHGKLTFVATADQTDFAVKGATTLVPGTLGNGFATAIADTTDLRNNHVVKITSKEANTGNRGSDYTSADTVAGEVTTLEIEALEISGNNMRIKALDHGGGPGNDAQEGYNIKAGDIVTVELKPTAGNQAAFRADRLLSVHSNSDTETEITFKASNGTAADDTVLLTHPDNNGAEFKLISSYIYEACNANINERGGIIRVSDIQNNILGKGLADAGVTNMLLAIA
tara:strand:+ start:324 stop:1025 length:702 start_codon:yes stop_codon:yes gene_type:complete